AGKYRSAVGVLEAGGAGFYMRPPGDNFETEAAPRPFELYVRALGHGDVIARRLCGHAKAWDATGRPGADGLRIRALPIDVAYEPGPHEHVVEKRWSRLVLDRPA